MSEVPRTFDELASITGDQIFRFFAYEHLPAPLQEVSRGFGELARIIACQLVRGPERTVALRKLLEAKDAAVRAALPPLA